jgi:muramoyltetrapeptide carboxypeptidase
MQSIKSLKNRFGIISTGGPLPKAREELAMQNITSLGFSQFQTLSSSEFYGNYSYGFANGSPQMRLHAINLILENEEVDCLLAGRGATGSLEIISALPFDKWAKSKKTLIGDSDVTSILVQLAFKYNLPAIHGSTFGASFADYYLKQEAKESVDCLIKMLTDKNYRQEYSFTKISNFKSEVIGKVICGNLTMLCSLLGTPYDIDYSDKILILEEVGEAPYRVQRMLFQLFHAGKFKNIKGLCFGRLTKCESTNGPDVIKIIETFFSDLKIFDFPLVLGLEIGHWGKNLPVPLGCNVKITEKSVLQIESPLEILN